MARFMSTVWLVASCWFTFVAQVSSLASTDTITWGGDVGRSGYQPNHNMDPAIVGSASFGQIFKTALPGNWNGIGPEQIFSQPLVYTGADGIQYIYLATTQNNIYKINAKTGVIVSKRNLWVPFLTADLDGCVDINPTVGVTATGVIDPSTGIWYFTAKTYSMDYQGGNFSPQKTPGRLNGRYYFHAINTADLTDAFAPTPLEGTVFRNNPNRMFLSGNQHQRPALLQVGNYIYTGFASHCVKWNFTGAIVGFNKNTGAIVEAFATEGGPESNTIPGGGVWMSGGGLAYDGKGSMYFATGNGYASQLPATGMSVPGRNPPTALEEAAVNAKINDDGTLSIIDFFMPWEKTQLDGADKDLGTSPLEILPSDTFSCPNHKRIGVVTGKSGKTYWLNLDNLGGYQMGPGKLDNVIQVFQNENSVYAGAGVMPLGGGYIYINVIQYASHVFKFSCNAAGNAVFTKVADTNEKCAYVLGVGHGTTTSLNGQDGTGLYWVSDVEGLNLRIYNAIPPTGGNLTLLNSFNIPGVTKFTRPVFGDGRAYIGTTLGYLYGFGSPISLPLNCSSPYTFPNTPIGNSSAPMTVQCTSNIQTTVNSIALTGNANYNISGLPTLPLTLNPGNNFTFQAVFNPKSVGLLSSDVVVNTTNVPTGYSTSTPITLKGNANSAKPLLALNPNTISFNTIAGQAPDEQSFIYANNGDGLLTIANVSYSLTSETGPWVTPNVTSNGTVVVGPFTFTNVPTSIPGNSIAPVTIDYNPVAPGNDAVFVKAFSDGGSALLDVVAVAGSQPVALFQFQTPDGSDWVNYVPGQNFTFGNVTENTTRNLKFRIVNNGSATAAPLSITVSKPPYGVPGIVGAVNNIDLAEGSSIPAGQSQNATLFCSPPKTQVNTPGYSQSVQWTINTGDPTLGKQFINFVCNAVSEQVGPTFGNGTAVYQYVGCARDNNPGRQLATQVYADTANNTNDRCIATCFAQGYAFAGTEYNQQCWCGNAVPLQFDAEVNCNFQCTGNSAQTCGGNGFYGNQSQISLFADTTKFNGNKTSPPLQIVPSTNGYNYVGCYAESGGKALSAKSTSSKSMTIQYCANYCSGFPYYGVEYGVECYCGNTIATSVATVTADSQCNMVCPGSNSQYCGNGNRMLIYGLNATSASSSSSSSATASATSSAPATTSSVTTTTSSIVPTTTGVVPSASGFVSLGCYNENTGSGGRVLATLYANDGMTIEMCAAQAQSQQANYFGVEYARECWYGPTLSNISQPISQSKCSMVCPGNTGEWCGGGNALQMYNLSSVSTTTTTTTSSTVSSQTSSASSISITSSVSTSSVSTSSAAPTTSSASVSSSSTASPTSSSATPTGPSVVPSATGFVSMGCQNEDLSGATRVLPNLYADDSMTIEMCAAQAQSQQALFFGVEYGRECWYGATLSNISQPIDQSKCYMLCPGNQYEYCGGPNALQMYRLAPTSSSSSVSSSATATATVTSSAVSSAASTGSATSTSSSVATSSTTSSSSLSSTSSVVSTSSSASTSSVPSTSSSASTSPVASTSSAASTSSVASTSSSASTSAVTSSSSTSSSITSSSRSSSSSSATTLSTITSSSTSSSTSSATPSQTPLTCPGSNSTIWQAPSGANYTIECGIDHQGGDINSTTVKSFEACITACDNQKGCVDISLSGTACYMKGTLGKALFNNKGIKGAKLIIPSSSSSATASATASASAKAPTK